MEDDDGHLKKQGETTREGAVAFLLLKLHDLLLLLLQSGLIGSSSVFCFDKFDFGGKSRHFDLILLLFNREGKKQNLKDERIN
jgi:hypothetical protein